MQMEVDVQRNGRELGKGMEELDEENRNLKQVYANQALDNQILWGVIEKNYRARGPEFIYEKFNV